MGAMTSAHAQQYEGAPSDIRAIREFCLREDVNIRSSVDYTQKSGTLKLPFIMDLTNTIIADGTYTKECSIAGKAQKKILVDWDYFFGIGEKSTELKIVDKISSQPKNKKYFPLASTGQNWTPSHDQIYDPNKLSPAQINELVKHIQSYCFANHITNRTNLDKHQKNENPHAPTSTQLNELVKNATIITYYDPKDLVRTYGTFFMQPLTVRPNYDPKHVSAKNIATILDRLQKLLKENQITNRTLYRAFQFKNPEQPNLKELELLLKNDLSEAYYIKQTATFRWAKFFGTELTSLRKIHQLCLDENIYSLARYENVRNGVPKFQELLPPFNDLGKMIRHDKVYKQYFVNYQDIIEWEKFFSKEFNAPGLSKTFGVGLSSWFEREGYLQELTARAYRLVSNELYVAFEGITKEEQALVNKLPKKMRDSMYRHFNDLKSKSTSISSSDALRIAARKAMPEIPFAESIEIAESLAHAESELVETFSKFAGIKNLDKALYGQAKFLLGFFFIQLGRELNENQPLDIALNNAFTKVTSNEGLISLSSFLATTSGLSTLSELTILPLIKTRTLDLTKGMLLLSGASRLGLFGGTLVEQMMRHKFEVGQLFGERLATLPNHLVYFDKIRHEPWLTALETFLYAETTMNKENLYAETETFLAKLKLFSPSSTLGSNLEKSPKFQYFRRKHLREYPKNEPSHLSDVDIFARKLALQTGSSSKEFGIAASQLSLTDALAYTGILLISAPTNPLSLANMSFLMATSTALSQTYETWKNKLLSDGDLDQVYEKISEIVQKDKALAQQMKQLNIPQPLTHRYIQENLESLIENAEYNRQAWRREILKYERILNASIDTAISLTHQFMRAHQIRRDGGEKVMAPLLIAEQTITALKSYGKGLKPTHDLDPIDEALRSAYYARLAIHAWVDPKHIPWFTVTKPISGCDSDMTSCLNDFVLQHLESTPARQHDVIKPIDGVIRDHILDSKNMLEVKRAIDTRARSFILGDTETIANYWDDAFSISKKPAVTPKRIYASGNKIIFKHLLPGHYAVFAHKERIIGPIASERSKPKQLTTFTMNTGGTRQIDVEAIKKHCRSPYEKCLIYATYNGQPAADLLIHLTSASN